MRKLPNPSPDYPTSDKPSYPDISSRLEENLKSIEGFFANCKDLKIYPWNYGQGLEHSAFTVYFDTLTKTTVTNFAKDTLQNLVPHELGPAETVTIKDIVHYFENHGIASPNVELMSDMQQAVRGILDGKVVIFFNGWPKAIAYFALDVEQRQTSEPITEPTVQGPHVSFIESLDRNIGVIRSLLKSHDLKFEYFTSGEKAHRTVSYGYLDGVVKPETLEVFKQKIKGIDQEEIIEVSYLEEWVNDSNYSPFPQVRYTERPDTAITSLLDGKIIALVDGSPAVLICPGKFIEFFTNSEDYYYRTIFSSLIRLIRLAAFLIALMLPSTYIALSTFHSELIPTVLLLAILDTREGIPFPAMIEALIMEFFFELLREAGIRLPRPIGSAVSIVGALVIGQAAIQSQIASPVMVIVVALTGIASFALPQYNMAVALRILRFPLMFLAATFGGLGIMVGFILIYLHLATLRSLGEPYLDSLAPLDVKRLRDTIFVLPRRLLVHSPRSRHLHKKSAGRKKS
ncbi:spore germination protein [Paenibacillus radicis (ex Gao et al. 2016)]|uniref:Spore germination protein n=1 Tax=Paenibacillus radicis (ex Gao et al. 2016) TaxID=1737354 RepID=A0A917HT85_9BACL|nr:spore germination protein [Paenibacillus radicis (ex Gao et al. 2016)]GGG88542.1 spore germination protein [Paenibacillus radicis (ex Gao et al. 2016)]